MRTIRVELAIPIPSVAGGLEGMFGSGGKIHMSTEAIIAEDNDAREAGAAAARVLDDFITGYTEEQTA